MSHLNEIEFVDYLDGALPPARAAHVDLCDACRRQVESLRQAVRRTAEAEVPEPSPLFWEHFSQRVREVVHDGGPVAPAGRARWLRAPVFGWTVAAITVVLAVAAIFWADGLRPSLPMPAPSQVTVQTPSAVADPVALDLENDEEWALVRVVAEDLEWDNAHEAGINARPGSAERVALEMSAAERQELARLIEDEIKRTGA